MSDFEFQPVTAENWPDLAQFFEQHGNPNYCWCMRWRLRSGEYSAVRSSDRRSKLETMVREGTPIGVLAFHEGTTVGWCSIAPRETYIGLERSRILKRLDDRPVWSVVCFFIDSKYRHQGLASRMLKAAVSYAASQGAAIVEGYPVEPDKSYRFMGSPAAFESVGFQQAGTATNGRIIMRIETTK
ncbi:MAG: GNAT family N-acetyltransferase [Candidatus Promineifilaceae bacterium]